MITIIDIATGENFKALAGSASYEQGNCEAARLVWQVPYGLTRPADIGIDDWDEPAPFNYLQRVKVQAAGTPIMIGQVVVCRQSFSAGGERIWDVEVADDFWLLDNTPWCQTDSTGHLTSGVYQAGATVSYGSGYDTAGNPVPPSIGGTCSMITAIKQAYPDAVITAKDCLLITFSMTGTTGQILRSIQSQLPWLVMWFDASGVLKIADLESLSGHVFDRQKLTSVSINERHDLVPPVVGVMWSGQHFEAGKWVNKTSYYVQPKKADPRQPGAMIYHIQSPSILSQSSKNDDQNSDGLGSSSFNFVKPEMAVRGVETNTPQWWQSKVALLKNLPNPDGLIWGKSEVKAVPNFATDSKTYSADATRYELTEGALSDSLRGVKWCFTSVKRWVISPTKPPAEFAAIFSTPINHGGEIYWGGLLEWQGNTINRPKYYYRVAPEGYTDEGEAPFEDDNNTDDDYINTEPDYHKVIDEYFAKTRKVPIEGNIEIYHDSLLEMLPGAIPFIGSKINITGRRTSWATMDATVEKVRLDLSDFKSSFSLGVPAHLSLQDTISRLKDINEAQAKTSVNNTTDKAPDNNGGPEFTMPDPERRKSAKAPTISPTGSVITSAGEPSPLYGFVARYVYDQAGQKTGIEVRQGKVIYRNTVRPCPSNSGAEWIKFPIKSQVFCNVTFDANGNFTSANLTTDGSQQEVTHFGDKGARGYGGESFYLADQEGTAKVKKSGKRSYPVCTDTGAGISQFALGFITADVSPAQLIYELVDAYHDPKNNIAPDSSEGAPVSIIQDKQHAYCKLKMLAKGKSFEVVTDVKFAAQDDSGLAEPDTALLKVTKKKILVQPKTVIVQSGSGSNVEFDIKEDTSSYALEPAL